MANAKQCTKRTLEWAKNNVMLVAYIVPFRDTPGQDRGEQWSVFLHEAWPRIQAAHADRHHRTFLCRVEDPLPVTSCTPADPASTSTSKGTAADSAAPWGTCVLERFNRGACCNVGALAAGKRGADVLVFHDVDLIPDVAAATLYAVRSEALRGSQDPLVDHWGHLWRGPYTADNFIGGITACSAAAFAAASYCNTCCGWGGEDDVWRLRLQRAAIPIGRPPRAGNLRNLDRFVRKPRNTLNMCKLEDVLAAADDMHDAKLAWVGASACLRSDVLLLRLSHAQLWRDVFLLRKRRPYICWAATWEACSELEAMLS